MCVHAKSLQFSSVQSLSHVRLFATPWIAAGQAPMSITKEYYSAIKKNTVESVLMRWMKLEPIIQSEASQKEKHQYTVLTHKYAI